MAKKLDKSISRLTPQAIVVHANHAVLHPDARVGEFCVSSRMLLWCRGGHGRVTVNGQARELTPGAFLVLPWAHRIRYWNPGREPWRLGGVHVVPALRLGTPVVYRVRHTAADTIPHESARRDVRLPALATVVAGDLRVARRLEWLAEYLVEVFLAAHGAPPEVVARLAAQVLLEELTAVATAGAQCRAHPAPALQRLMDHVDANLGRPLPLSELARQERCSPATVWRLFTAGAGVSPSRWQQQRRMARAAELLTGTDLRVHEVAEQLGFADPGHFSRVFKRIRGVSPRAQRAAGWRL